MALEAKKEEKLTDEETFDEAFKEATGEESEADDEGKDKKDEDLAKLEEEEEAKGKEDEGDKKEVSEPDVEQLKKEAEENKRLFEEEKQRRKSLEGMYNSDQETKKKLSEELESLRKTKDADKKTQDEVDPELDEYMKEYDYIAKSEAKLRDREWQKRKDELLTNISELLKVPLSKVEQAVGRFEADETVKHKEAVQEAHPDFGTAFKRDDIIKWVDTLPSGVKKAYTEIADGGSTEDVIFLMSEYKRVQGIETITDDGGDDEKDLHKKERLKKMEAVITKKKAVSGSYGKAEDFDGAWNEATK
jgi:hypothetical protein